MGIVGSIGFGVWFALYPAFLVFGAVIQPRFPLLGRGFICFGAILLTFWVSDIAFFAVVEGHLSDKQTMIGLMSVLLVAACDVAIVIEELRIRRAKANAAK